MEKAGSGADWAALPRHSIAKAPMGSSRTDHGCELLENAGGRATHKSSRVRSGVDFSHWNASDVCRTLLRGRTAFGNIKGRRTACRVAAASRAPKQRPMGLPDWDSCQRFALRREDATRGQASSQTARIRLVKQFQRVNRMCDDPNVQPEGTDPLDTIGSEPASVSVDGQSFSNHSISQQIELDRYKRSIAAARAGAGPVLGRIVPLSVRR